MVALLCHAAVLAGCAPGPLTMDDRILATARLCLNEAKHAPDPAGYILSFAKALIRKGWSQRTAKRVYFVVTSVLYGKPPRPRKRAVHQVRFVISN